MNLAPTASLFARLALAALLTASLLPATALALSYCASDGQKPHSALLERFVSADCADCWRDPATRKAPAGALALDWIVPGSQGDDAPMSAVATRDAADRLMGLGASLHDGRFEALERVHPVPGLRLRVAHGLPVNDYIGTSIEAAPPRALRTSGEVNAWLLLVETIPAGVEGSPVERNIVRNAFITSWSGRDALSKQEQKRFYESRPMRVADGARTPRLRVVGWLQDAQVKVLATAASRCEGK